MGILNWATSVGRAATLAALCACSLHAADVSQASATPMFKQYCFQCHGKVAMGGISLENLTAQTSVGANFQHWQKVATALEQKRMPPAKMPQPTDVERRQAVTWIRAKLSEFASRNAGDPGRVTVRRLTGGEYAYAVRDLTGIELNFDREFANDSVGGEGFTNFGDVQFMQDANLEAYLGAAKTIAAHAVVGSGPLQFYSSPGKSGFELSAISRIQEIYRANGFRAASGEGGQAYGLERYAKAFYAAWRYEHRAALGEPKATLDSIGAREGLSPRFVQHIWTVLQQPSPMYPTSEVERRFRKLPAPGVAEADKLARAGTADIQKFLIDWPRWLFGAGALAAGGAGDERALVITSESIQAKPSHRFRFALRPRGAQATGNPKIFMSIVSANQSAKEKTLVVWKKPVVRLRGLDRGLRPPQPLISLLDEATIKRLAFGKRPDGGPIGPEDFATYSDVPFFIDMMLPKGAATFELQSEVEIASGQSDNAVLRCTLSDREEPARGVPVWALLANPESAGYKSWRSGVLNYAANLPQTSHGEPTPSDKDPIPAPFNNVYNQPERDQFHVTLKYFRDDRFLVEKMLDDKTRARLEQAWSDLLASFDYHDTFLRFIAGKYKLELKKKGIGDLTPAEIEAMAVAPRQYIKALRAEYDAVRKSQKSAQPGHLDDSIRLASNAWRRPLTPVEKDRLRSFYVQSREVSKLTHDKAIRALLARILVAPAFLYRLENAAINADVKPLSNWEIASRLSFFLWSSIPDDELRRAAAAGELNDSRQLDRQVKRMLADAKAQRFATEFFGQWLGFYRFDQYRGVDSSRFPEFTDSVKSGMYDEAVAFFEHIVRNDRPLREIFFADYTFLTPDLARHYGIKKDIAAKRDPVRVDGAGAYQRGGVLRLGAVLTATSAPLRTSPVKRGDWVLRRILGTPTPPPPADAGSLPADDKAFGGMSVKQRLESHQRNATCAGCHSRIDPMGFPLERYDAVGRWRDKYQDGKPIEDSAKVGDQAEIAGVQGLLEYLKKNEPQVLRNLSQKLVGYSLGRTILISDQPLIDRMIKGGGESTFSQLAAEIVGSRQFRNRRERDDTPPVTLQTARAPVAMKSLEGDR